MKDYNQEYFYVLSAGLDSYPSLQYVKDGGNFVEIDKLESDDITTKRILGFRNSATIPNPQLADFHKLKKQSPVISERLKKILESFNFKDTQFLPVLIRDDNGVEHDGYYILHVYNKIKCMDWENSVWEKDRFNKAKANIISLVLNNEAIDAIPLNERLVFKVWEDSTKLLFHQSIVEKILEAVPTGLTIANRHVQVKELPFFMEFEKQKALNLE